MFQPIKESLFVELTMMHSMMRRCIKDVFQRSNASNGLRVDPKLENKIELGMYEHNWRWNEKCHRQIERLLLEKYYQVDPKIWFVISRKMSHL